MATNREIIGSDVKWSFQLFPFQILERFRWLQRISLHCTFECYLLAH